MRKAAIGAVVALFLAINYYLGIRGQQWLQAIAPGHWGGWLYWIPFGIISLSFLVARFARERLPGSLAGWMARVGAYWLLVYMYVLPLLLLLDLVRLALGLFGWWPAFGPGSVARFGDVVAGALVIVAFYGTWRARRPVVSRYEIAIDKRCSGHTEMHVVLLSDSHLGAINGPRRLKAMVEMVTVLQPDLLLLAGDVIDDDAAPFYTLDMAAGLRQLQSKLGAYSVLGNHEYMAGRLTEYRQELARAGIRLLVDEWVKVADAFYVIGRDDISGRHMSGRSRKPLSDLLAGVDRSLPLFLMDHQPYHLEEAEQAGINLQVSGHTHRGQMFPNNLLTRRIFEVDWGYLKKGALHVIVSLGFGTWGPPVRIGNRPEVVSIRIKFKAE